MIRGPICATPQHNAEFGNQSLRMRGATILLSAVCASASAASTLLWQQVGGNGGAWARLGNVGYAMPKWPSAVTPWRQPVHTIAATYVLFLPHVQHEDTAVYTSSSLSRHKGTTPTFATATWLNKPEMIETFNVSDNGSWIWQYTLQ